MAQLKALQERSFDSVDPFAIFLDGYHIGSAVFIVGLLIDTHGKKHVLASGKELQKITKSALIYSTI